MEPGKVKTTLERFYAGETNDKEEAFLRKFFAQPEVPEEFSAEKQHFLLLMQWKEESRLGNAFDNRIMKQITTPAKPGNAFSAWYLLAGVAASVMLILALWVGNRQDKQTVLPGTANNPALAYAQARTALQVVAGTLNQGLQPAAKAATEINGAMKHVAEIRTLKRAVEPVRKLSEWERARKLLEPLNKVYVNIEPVKK